MILNIRIGDLYVRTLFGVAESLAMDLRLGTFFINSSVMAICSGEHKMAPWNSPPIAVIKSHNASILFTNDLETQKCLSNPRKSLLIPFSKAVNVPPITQHSVQVSTTVTSEASISPLQPDAQEARTKAVAAHGIIDVASSQPFPILVSNFSNQTIKFCRGENIAIAPGPQDRIIQPIEQDTWKHTNVPRDVDAAPVYKEPATRENQIDRHGQVKSADNDTSKRDLKEGVQIGQEYA